MKRPPPMLVGLAVAHQLLLLQPRLQPPLRPLPPLRLLPP
jgi:hypothetical protein